MKTTELRIADLNLNNVEEIPAIYQIRNVLTDYVFISSTENLKTHLKTLLYAIEHKYDRIPEKLLKDYHNMGSKMFALDILQTDGVTKDTMSHFKDMYMEQETRLYNIKRLSKGGGFEVVSNEAYVLDLEGNILSKHPSVQAAYSSVGTAAHYGGVNTSARTAKHYRVVTTEFYNTNLVTILSWNKYNDYAKYRSELYKKSIQVAITIKRKTKVFNNSGELAKYLDCNKETIRLILNGTTKSNPYNIRFANPDAIEELRELKESEKNKKELVS